MDYTDEEIQAVKESARFKSTKARFQRASDKAIKRTEAHVAGLRKREQVRRDREDKRRIDYDAKMRDMVAEAYRTANDTWDALEDKFIEHFIQQSRLE